MKLYKRVDEPTVTWMMSVLEQNVAIYYEKSSWKWNATDKRIELTTSGMEYIFIHECDLYENDRFDYEDHHVLSDDKKILAFAAILPHTPEPKRDCYQKKNLKSQDYQEVMYCYELQVTNFYQGQGLGKKMIKMIHAHTLRLGLDRVVLSCFKKNRIAWKFYTKKHAYIPDYEDSEYGILSIEL